MSYHVKKEIISDKNITVITIAVNNNPIAND